MNWERQIDVYMSIVVVIFGFTCSLWVIEAAKPICNNLIQRYKPTNWNKKKKNKFIETQISAVNESVSDILDFRKRINKSEMDTVRYKSEIENEFFHVEKNDKWGIAWNRPWWGEFSYWVKYFMKWCVEKEIEKSSVAIL